MVVLVERELAIIPVGSADLAATAALVNAAFEVHGIMSEPRTSIEGLLEEAGDDGAFIQAVDADGLLATALIRHAASYYADPAHADALYFGLAAVRPVAMRSGLGRALVTRAEHLAVERGHRRVVLSTLREFNLVPYYERLGYHTTKTQDFEAGHWSVVVPHRYHEMQKTLA